MYKSIGYNIFFESGPGLIDIGKYIFENKYDVEKIHLTENIIEELGGIFIRGQYPSFFLKLNHQKEIEEIILLDDMMMHELGFHDKAIKFETYSKKYFKSIKENYKINIRERDFKIASKAMLFFDAYRPSPDSSQVYFRCKNGNYVCQNISYIPNRKSVNLEELKINFPCCNKTIPFNKKLLTRKSADISVHKSTWNSFFCDDCKKYFGGLNDKKKWTEYIEYNGKEIESDEISINGLEEYGYGNFDNGKEFCIKITRKDSKSFGDESKDYSFERNKYLA